MKKIIVVLLRYLSVFVSNKLYIKIVFRYRLKRKLNLDNPVFFNDKIQWLKLYYVGDESSIYADKFLVREYVEKTIGKQYLNELYGSYDDAFSIDESNLPKKYIIKLTHASGLNLIKNGDPLSFKDKQLINKWKNKKHYKKNREFVYKNIKPRIIVEKLLEDSEYNQILDYKIHCFHGQPAIIQVNYNIDGIPHRNIYDLEWNRLEVEWIFKNRELLEIGKPNKLNLMLELATKLSSLFVYSRIDFYHINNQVIFGEITFFPASGTVKLKPIAF